MPEILENILVMILTIVVPLAGGFLVLLVLGWWLKIKSGGREQQGLTDLWIANQADQHKSKSEPPPTDDAQ